MNDVSAIIVKDVNFFYNGTPVLENVSFAVGRGEFLSVVGPNGGGKTTLLKLILGLMKPNSGKIRVLGMTPERARGCIGYMPQQAQFDPQFPVSVMDVVLMGTICERSIGIYSKRDRKAAERSLSEVEMSKYIKHSFSELSGGQRQRVLLARALISRPQILLLDEPTANVDMGTESKLDRILKEMAQLITILMVTHDLGLVSDVVHRVLCVNRKVVVHPTSALSGTLIQDLYGTDLRLVHHDRISGEGAESHD
jgi:zinc transport system ATP-binding protein